MGHQNDPAVDSRSSDWDTGNASPPEQLELVGLNAVRAAAADETAAEIARALNEPLTALLLYLGEIKHHSHRLPPVAGDRAHLQRVVANALAQTERVCTLVRQLAGADRHVPPLPSGLDEAEQNSARALPSARPAGSEPSHLAGQKRLTRREREVLRLISEGNSNKQGALRMQISPRTFESHRAEAMRKLGARNTAELVRAALLQAID